MSLQRRLMLAIFLLLVCLLAANMVVTVYNARQNMYLQLEVHAQDTATSLGFSISQAAEAKDVVQVSSMIDVIFDRGYYRRIVYRDLEGKDVVRRELPLQFERVPHWFTRWLHLPEPAGEAVVSSGWYQLGHIAVVSHPGFAYQDLWRAFKEQLWLFLVTIALCYGLLGLGLKILLRPLRQLEAQADAISRREFIQSPLPSIPELRRVVSAMNRMVEKVKALFSHQVELNDRLHQQLRTDEVTGLSNRHDFDARLSAYLKSERTADSGALMLMQVGDLSSINRTYGREEGDACLRVIAQCLIDSLADFHDVLCSRHSGTDFAVFIPAISDEESRSLMERLHGNLHALAWRDQSVQTVYIGVVYVSAISRIGGQDESHLLALADAALNQARQEQQGAYCWQLLADTNDQAVRSVQQWSTLLQKALADRAFGFHYQPVWQVVHGQKRLLFNELLTQLLFDGQSHTASVFMPMAMRLQLMPVFDRAVVETVFTDQSTLPEQVCINISAAALGDMLFIRVLEQQLSGNPALAARLIFELPATSLSFSEQAVRDFALLIKRFGAKLSLHHFGRGTAEFAYLQSLPLDYLKIDRCFIQSITHDKDAQFFVRSLVAIAQSCDVMVLAEGVETEAQWQQLIVLGIQGGQGYWLGRPQPDPVIG